ncbi:MAG: sialate O-acetylesterase [bacterium]
MSDILRRTLSLGSLVALSLTASVCADVRMPGVFSDHMVLQRDAAVPVWGWAAPGERVAVRFGGKSASGVAGKDGKWLVKLPAMTVNAVPQELTVSGRNTVTITDVLVGDVWLGSGQSNMEMALRDIEKAKEEMATAAKPLIRLFTVPRNEKSQVAEDVPSKWAPCTPENIAGFSAVLYLFGREINAEAKVPVGLIHSSVGGTRIELWTAPEGLAAVPEFAGMTNSINNAEKQFNESLPAKITAMEEWLPKAKAALAGGGRVPLMPDWPQHPNPGVGSLYHGMIYPLVPFALRGFVWYQGEWNGGEDEIYHQRMKALIAGWRSVWGHADLPFYYVQLARMPEKEHSPWSGNGLAPTRDAQRRSLDIPHTGMATIIDLEGSSGWHPGNKQDVGKRLALWALRNEYGRTNLVASGPLYTSRRVEGNAIRVSFDSVGSGLVVGTKTGREPMKLTPDQPLKNFAIAGADKKWVHARAVISGNDVLVSAPEVAKPAEVRYAYCQDPVGCNLFNWEGLPASPFKTDEW